MCVCYLQTSSSSSETYRTQAKVEKTETLEKAVLKILFHKPQASANVNISRLAVSFTCHHKWSGPGFLCFFSLEKTNLALLILKSDYTESRSSDTNTPCRANTLYFNRLF